MITAVVVVATMRVIGTRESKCDVKQLLEEEIITENDLF